LAEGNTGTEADFFASMVGESGSAATISHDPENQLTTGSDGGIFAPAFKYKTTDW
jgi:dTDP-4-amino-4,6-dideoxygalactose transaminase